MNILQSEKARLTQPKILFVDDEDRILQGLKRMLRPLAGSFQLLFANSCSEALEKIKAENIDIICTDMKMPGKDGAQLLEEARKITPSTIRIVLSGQAEEHHVLRALPHAHQYLPKPCDATNLKETIETISLLSKKLPNAKIRQLILSLSAIPSQKNILSEFNTILNSENPSVEDLSELAKMDIGITTKILHLVSSGFLRAKTSANSINEAINIIGIDTLKKLFDNYPIFYSLEDPISQKILEQTNNLAILIAVSLEEHSRNEQCPNPELSYLRGITIFSGRALLCTEYPTLYNTYFSKDSKSRESLCNFEKQMFGISSIALSSTISYLWGIVKIFKTPKGDYKPIPNLIEMLEQREKQLFNTL